MKGMLAVTSSASGGQCYEDFWGGADSGKKLCLCVKPQNRSKCDSKKQTQQVES